VPDAKRPDPKRRSPGTRPGKSQGARQRPRSNAARRERPAEPRQAEPAAESITSSIAAAVARQSERRLGLTARRAAILAAVICVLTLTIAGPVRTYFAQRADMQSVQAEIAANRAAIEQLKTEQAKLSDPVYIKAQARDRLGFVMPGETPYQVQLPPGAAPPSNQPGTSQPNTSSNDPWYTALWRTIADTPHNIPPPASAPPPPPGAPPPPPGG
jgi:cell division protein DivIC